MPKVPLVTAVYVHNQRAADSYKPNSGPNDAQLFSHHLSYGGVPANGVSNGHYYPSQPASYGSTLATGTLDKQGASTRVHSSPERQRRNSVSLLNRVPEDRTMDYDHEAEGSRYVVGASLDGDDEGDELELEEELAAEGLYQGEAFIGGHVWHHSLIFR